MRTLTSAAGHATTSRLVRHRKHAELLASRSAIATKPSRADLTYYWEPAQRS